MLAEAQVYIDQWTRFASVSGGFATMGLIIGIIGAARAWRMLGVVWYGTHPMGLRLVALGDTVVITLLLIATALQLATALLLVLLARQYPAALSSVLITLDGAVTRVYAGYLAHTIVTSCALPGLLVLRLLAMSSRWEREAVQGPPPHMQEA